jgi:hypothetical protein
MRGVLCAGMAAGALAACSLTTPPRISARPAATDEEIARLWVEPEDAERNLFWGPGGQESAPHQDHSYRMTALDESGYSRGYDAVGPDGREWRIKTGLEAQSEIVASRLLWAIGFHQPATYALESWKLEGVRAPRKEIARFRLKDGYRNRGEWSWHDNPFVGTREFKGLLVAQLLLNNWDLKRTNNRIYELQESGAGRRTWFVVQDLGATLGAPRWPTGTRNNVSHFERHRFITGLAPEGLQFGYAGRHRELFKPIEPSDIVWTCRRLARLTDRQWRDAFRAAHYPDEVAARFITTLRSKIQQGLALIPQSGNDS